METKERRTSGTGRKPRSGTTGGGHRSRSAATEKPKQVPKKTAARKPAPSKRPARKPAEKQPTPDVVYVQPTPFNRGRFILCIVIAVAVVLAVVFGMSIFFKVDADKILVSGADKYSVAQIVEASGIKDGENLMSISEPRISNSIIAQLPYVNRVRVGIKLPDTVKIEIEELAVVYSVEDSEGGWWLLRSDGGVVEQTNSAEAQQYTRILGVKITEPIQGEMAVAYQPTPESPEGETEPVTVFASEQLSAVCTIAQYLEDSGIIGELTSIDVTNLGDIQMWYGEQYQILLGDTMELSYKIRTLKSTLDQMGSYQSGVLDVSFTVWQDQVGYTPFS